MVNSHFQKVDQLRPKRSLFDLSYTKMFNCEMGQLIPVMCDEAVPGDIFKIANDTVIRFAPMLAPIIHQVDMSVHYFFVPYRVLWDDWEGFITQTNANVVLPKWKPTKKSKFSLWDYFGFPVDKDFSTPTVLDFPRMAYNFIYNEYYRQQDIVDEIALTNEDILYRSWAKDYFTSALSARQRGPAPKINLGTSAKFFAKDPGDASRVTYNLDKFRVTHSQAYSSTYEDAVVTEIKTAGGHPVPSKLFTAMLNNNKVSAFFDVSDLRRVLAVQRWLERNMRAGTRYTEFLRSHYGVAPRDERLDRPEYIGGVKSPVVISEVLQTSQSDNTTKQPIGKMAGHGLGVMSNMAGVSRVYEHGLIMGIFSVMPSPSYSQGVNRQWTRESVYDFYFREFANLSEQPIKNSEIYLQGDSDDNGIFGYAGRYDEMRVKNDMYVADMRDTLNYWHMGRVFANAPSLNKEFLECKPSKRGFSFQTDSIPSLIVSSRNKIKAVRPMPSVNIPSIL